MTDKRENKLELTELALKAFEGANVDDSISRLEEMLSQDADRLDEYIELAVIYSTLTHPYGLFDEVPVTQITAEDFVLDMQLWQALAENEKTAPEVHIENPIDKPVEPRLGMIKAEKPKRMISRLSIYTLALSAAAMLLLMVIVLVKPVRPVVGILTDSINAEWITTEEVPAKGDVLRQGDLVLSKGFVQIYFNKGDEVIVRAPATLKLEGPGQLFMESGNISVKVEDICDGFLVRTAGATMVDYGTEFGVIAHADGRTEVHVFDGDVGLRTGSDPLRFGQAMRLKKGQASGVDSGGKLSNVITKASPRRFVRQLSNPDYFAFPGDRVDLADIVGGGNGFGTGYFNGGIDAGTGGFYENYWDHSASGVSKPTELGPYRYNEVAELAYVDGVFVPSDKAGPIKVTSQGHELLNCPVASGDYYKKGIINGAEPGRKPGQAAKILLDEKEYGTREHPAILMRRNKGITFDLEAIRADLPGSRITRFRALAGIADSKLGGKRQATFVVLVDGKIRFMRSAVTYRTGGIPISLELGDNDRLLTLITAYEVVGGTHLSVFAEPTLELEYSN